MAATAATTYALTDHNTTNVTTTPSSAMPTYSDAERSAAKDKVCKLLRPISEVAQAKVASSTEGN